MARFFRRRQRRFGGRRRFGRRAGRFMRTTVLPTEYRGNLGRKRNRIYQKALIATETEQSPYVAAAAGGDVVAVVKFRLVDIQPTLLTNLVARWRKYRIRGVKVTFGGPPYAGGLPSFAAYVNPVSVCTNIVYNNAIATASFLDLLAVESSKTRMSYTGAESVYIPWPSVEAQVTSTSGTQVAGGEVPIGAWLDTSQTGIEHWGLQVAFRGFNAANLFTAGTAQIVVMICYYIEFAQEK